MARFGNLRVPNWAVYENGVTRYEMISLLGSDQVPAPTLFAPPGRDQPGGSVRDAGDAAAPGVGQAHQTAIRGEAAAVADAEAMVEAMGGRDIWSRMKTVHFVHEWHPWNRVDTYIEHEILDLAGPRSWVDRKSEINHTMRAYSPEGRRWTVDNGTFAYASDQALASDLERAPFNFYRLVRAVAAGDPDYEVRFGKGDIPGTRRLEFYGRNGVLGGWIILNARKEPIVKATPEYRYTLGPLKRFGNLRVPAWGVYDTGTTRYEMVSLTGGSQSPDSGLFLPPLEFQSRKSSR
jgi:hypothetical protein